MKKTSVFQNSLIWFGVFLPAKTPREIPVVLLRRR